MQHFKTQWSGWLAGLGVVVVGLMSRFWQLGSFPPGMHQDEAWFAYNAWLLLKTGSNIYGEHWPLTVDMWGDHVSAIHSYFLVPFIALFGAHTAVFRSGIVVAGILAAGVVMAWLYRETKNQLLTLLTGLLVAVSPWAIVMSRASSSVMVDTLALAILVWVISSVIRQALASGLHTNRDRWQFWGGLLGSYILTMVCYVTYFTSRLLVPPFLVLLLGYYWWTHRQHWRALIGWGVGALVVAYLVFPFGYFLRTPYALGRYQETAILGSDTVKAALTAHIAQAGQAGIPPLITRLRYNKVTENFSAFFKQYVGLLSPSVLLFQNGPPARYSVPNGGSVTAFEYLGFVLALAGLLLYRPVKAEKTTVAIAAVATQTPNLRPLVFLVASLTLVAALPSALTQDDFPNLQRAVIMVPWFQVLAALGWFLVLQQVVVWPQTTVGKMLVSWLVKPLGLVIIVLAASAPSLASFWFGYTAQAVFERPFFRSRAGEELAVWINTHAIDAKILHEHVEGVFFYPYLFNQTDLRLQPIQKQGKYFLTSRNFWIGKRHFVSDLCASNELTKEPYDYYIFFTLHERCGSTGLMEKVFEAKYDDGSPGFTVYKPLATASAWLAPTPHSLLKPAPELLVSP